MSSRDGLVPLVKAVLGLGIAGVDGIGDFSLKTSGVGREGRCRGSRGYGGILSRRFLGWGSVL